MDDSTPLRRSLLFVPAAEERKLERAPESGADTLILDLEDSIAPERKADARRNAAEFLRAHVDAGNEVVVRVNALGSRTFQDDLEALVEAGVRTIMLPKCDSSESLQYVVRQLERIEGENDRDEREQVRILGLIESPLGVINAPTLSPVTSRLEALCFGHADFARDMGLPHSESHHGIVLHSRCQIAIAAKAFGLSAIDCVCLALKDEMAFREDAVLGAQLGFDGKMCIHPSQVRFANEVYTPSTEQVAYARRVVEGWSAAQAAGHGVFALEGSMIDAPLVAAQERILARARRTGMLEG